MLFSPLLGLEFQSARGWHSLEVPKHMTPDTKKAKPDKSTYYFELFDLIDGDFESTSEVSKCDACHRG